MRFSELYGFLCKMGVDYLFVILLAPDACAQSSLVTFTSALDAPRQLICIAVTSAFSASSLDAPESEICRSLYCPGRETVLAPDILIAVRSCTVMVAWRYPLMLLPDIVSTLSFTW